MHDRWLRGSKQRWIRREEAQDREAIRFVNTTAFGRENEANLVDRLREEAKTFLSLVAGEDHPIFGHLLLTSASLVSGNESEDILTLAPMAVLPRHQNCGIGSALVQTALEAARLEGHRCVTVLGHPAYYPRLGFVPAARHGILCEYEVPDEAFMLMELVPGGLQGRTGTVIYPAAFKSAM